MLTIIAPVKLNLNLNIVGLTAQNYHLLQSVVAFTKDGDILNISQNTVADQLTISGPFADLLSGDDNLITQAITKLRHQISFPFVTVHLTKNIPIQAGYGGGSSDAAAVLKGLKSLFQLNISHEILAQIGLELGADIPMCLFAKPAYIEGIGEHITPLLPLSSKKYACLLIKPDFMLSTPEIFSALKVKNNQPMPQTADKINYALTQGRNDLYTAALAIRPKLADYLSILHNTNPIKAAMSGSGSGFFALYNHQTELEEAADMIQQEMPHIFMMKTSINL